MTPSHLISMLATLVLVAASAAAAGPPTPAATTASAPSSLSSWASSFSLPSLDYFTKASYPKAGVTDAMLARVQRLLEAAPTPVVVHGARFLSRFAPLLPNSTKAGGAVALLKQRLSGLPALRDLPALARSGELPRAARRGLSTLLHGDAPTTGLAAVLTRAARRLSETDTSYIDLAVEFESLRGEAGVCSGEVSSQEFKDAVDELFDEMLDDSSSLGPSIGLVEQARAPPLPPTPRPALSPHIPLHPPPTPRAHPLRRRRRRCCCWIRR